MESHLDSLIVSLRVVNGMVNTHEDIFVKYWTRNNVSIFFKFFQARHFKFLTIITFCSYISF